MDTKHQLALVPTLETSRLILKGHESGHFNDCVKLWSSPEVVRYTIGQPSTPQRSWLRMLTYQGHWAMLGFGYWALILKSTGEFIGEVGFADFKRGLKELEERPELGWVLRPQFHGQGYATEALLAALRWADHNLKTPEICCLIPEKNSPSLQVAAKLNFKQIARVEYEQQTNIIFHRKADIN